MVRPVPAGAAIDRTIPAASAGLETETEPGFIIAG
jgi:hypothetical protein